MTAVWRLFVVLAMVALTVVVLQVVIVVSAVARVVLS